MKDGRFWNSSVLVWSACYCIDIERRNSLLVTHRSQRVAQLISWSPFESRTINSKSTCRQNKSLTVLSNLSCQRCVLGRYKSWTGSTRTPSHCRISSDQLGSTRNMTNIKLEETMAPSHLYPWLPSQIRPNLPPNQEWTDHYLEIIVFVKRVS